MVSILCVSFLLLGAVTKLTAAAATTNAGCQNGIYSAKPETVLFCSGGATGANGAKQGYNFPATFDVNLLDPALESLYISGFGATDVNVVSTSMVPFPARASLKTVQMSNFNQAPTDPRFPLNALFANLRQVLTTLFLENVKLATLTQADFTGFTALTGLVIKNGYLTSVSPSAFTGLGLLNHLTLSNNADLQTLDWAVLAPFANTLEALYVSGNNFAAKDSVTSSAPFTFKTLYQADLSKNRLTSVPVAIYQSFSSDASPNIDLTGQVFCRGRTDCGCCELADFAKWVRQAKSQYFSAGYAVGSITCGDVDVSGYGYTSSNASMSDPNLYAQCSPAVNTLKVTCVKGTMTKPAVDMENVEVAPVEYNGDTSRKCSNAAYELHQWIVQKANLPAVRTRSLLTDAGVVASCTGAGDIELNEKDPEVVTTSKVLFNFANTNKCRAIFADYLTLVLSK